jgi:cytochrome P450
VIDEFPYPSGPRGCPAARFAVRREHDPLGRVRLPSGDVVRLAVRYEDALRVLVDPRFKSDTSYEGAPRMQPGMNPHKAPGNLSVMDPPEHTRLRRLLSGAFTDRRVAGWRPMIRRRAEELLATLPGEFDFVADVAFLFPVQIICDVVGVPMVDTERIRGWTTTMLSHAGFTVEQQFAAMGEFAAYLNDLVAARRTDPGEGLLAALVELHDEDGELSGEEVVGVLMAMFIAGHEATGIVLARSLQRLLDPRERWESLAAHPENIPAVVEELLRLESPSHQGALMRVASEDVELPSGRIYRGEGVIAALTSANHDPSVFPDPAEMRLDGERAQHLTFVRGAHYCLGAGLARIEMQEMLAALIERFPHLTLTVAADDLPWTSTHMFTQPLAMPVSTGLRPCTEVPAGEPGPEATS